MIVDDEPAIRRLLIRWLAHEGWAATAVSSYADAAAAFSPGAFDLILCDVDLGEQPDGVALALNFRNCDPSLCVALMSGDPRNEDRAREAGLELFTKPFDTPAIRRLLDWAETARP